MRKPAQEDKNARPKRSAANRIQTYSLLQSGYYNEQRDLKRALKCSLIEAKEKNLLDTPLKQKKPDLLAKDHSSKKVNSIKKDDSKLVKSNKVDVKPIINDNKINDTSVKNKVNEEIVVKRFTAHRKFAQNCQPFVNNSVPVDFKEKESNGNKLSAVNKCPPTELVDNQLFTDDRLTANDFLTYLCFKDYLTLPFSLDKELNDEINSLKFETRKENAVELVENKKVKETFKENSKKMKLNDAKLKEQFNAKESKANQGKFANKLNGSGKFNNVKLNNKITQIKSQQTKVNQIKSNKLTKLAKLTKVKKEEKKQLKQKVETANHSTKKKQDNKIELNRSISSSFSKSSSSSDSSKNVNKIKKKDQKVSQNKKEVPSKLFSIKPNAKLSKMPASKLPDKLSNKLKPKLASKSKPKKTINKLRNKIIKATKEEVKTKTKQIVNTRKLRNGKFHHYQTKL